MGGRAVNRLDLPRSQLYRGLAGGGLQQQRQQLRHAVAAGIGGGPQAQSRDLQLLVAVMQTPRPARGRSRASGTDSGTPHPTPTPPHPQTHTHTHHHHPFFPAPTPTPHRLHRLQHMQRKAQQRGRMLLIRLSHAGADHEAVRAAIQLVHLKAQGGSGDGFVRGEGSRGTEGTHAGRKACGRGARDGTQGAWNDGRAGHEWLGRGAAQAAAPPRRWPRRVPAPRRRRYLPLARGCMPGLTLTLCCSAMRSNTR